MVMELIMNSTELIQDFVNTLHKDPSGDEERLSTPDALAQWLRARGLLEEEGANRSDLARAIELFTQARRRPGSACSVTSACSGTSAAGSMSSRTRLRP